MKRKQIAAWVLICGAVVLLALWGYARTGWDHTVRLQLVLHGHPFAKLRDEPPGSRHPHADEFGLAYRRSVYSRGRYVGCVERLGYFIRPEEDFGYPYPMVVVYGLYTWAQYLSAIMFVLGAMLLWKLKRNKDSQQSDGEASHP